MTSDYPSACHPTCTAISKCRYFCYEIKGVSVEEKYTTMNNALLCPSYTLYYHTNMNQQENSLIPDTQFYIFWELLYQMQRGWNQKGTDSAVVN